MSAWNWDSAYPAPAKLNLFLHVVGRRADGYHLLETLFRFVDYGDVLRFAPRKDGRIVRIDPLPGVAEDADLTVRAARLLQQAARIRQGAAPGVDIRLEKHLPMGGGVGGGSSDAATTLLALNHLWGTGLSRAELQQLGLKLGADVPVFVFGQAALARGIGEVLHPAVVSPAWYLVLVPPVHVETAAVFKAPELAKKLAEMRGRAEVGGDRKAAGKLTEAPENTTIAAFLAETSVAGEFVSPVRLGNDLQNIVAAQYPLVANHLEWLALVANAVTGSNVAMTGSGACVFAEFGGPGAEKEARRALANLPSGMRGWIAKGLEDHPLKLLAGDGGR